MQDLVAVVQVVQDLCRCLRLLLLFKIIAPATVSNLFCSMTAASIKSMYVYQQSWLEHHINPFQRHLNTFWVDTMYLSTQNVIKYLWKGVISCSSHGCRNTLACGSGINVAPNKLILSDHCSSGDLGQRQQSCAATILNSGHEILHTTAARISEDLKLIRKRTSVKILWN